MCSIKSLCIRWVVLFVHNSTMTIQQSSSKDRDESALSSKLSLNWTGPFKALRDGPWDSAPDGKPVGAKLLCWELPTGLRGVNARCRVSSMRCKPCLSPHDSDDRSHYLPAGFTEYALANVSERRPLFYITNEDAEPSVDVERPEVGPIVAHQFVRGRGEKMTV